ncbi:MAG: sulfatase-like hydrolase/transferase [Planctomycetota bacterium]|nr:sulfatase-like hydrolase/transferase [Planctomycetota bacterium]
MSDNGGGGGGGRGAVLSGGKGGLGEGGIRVPFCVTGPGVEPGAVIREPVVGFDLFPTFVELAGLEVPDGLDGSSFASALRGGDATSKPRDLLFHFPHYQGKATPQSALIRGSQKLVLEYESGRAALYDLEKDTAEARDLAAAEPDRAAELRAALLGLLEAHGADLPDGAGTGAVEEDGPATVPGPPDGPDPGARARPRKQRRR